VKRRKNVFMKIKYVRFVDGHAMGRIRIHFLKEKKETVFFKNNRLAYLISILVPT
jgi:hypothetical protein